MSNPRERERECQGCSLEKEEKEEEEKTRRRSGGGEEFLNKASFSITLLYSFEQRLFIDRAQPEATQRRKRKDRKRNKGNFHDGIILFPFCWPFRVRFAE